MYLEESFKSLGRAKVEIKKCDCFPYLFKNHLEGALDLRILDSEKDIKNWKGWLSAGTLSPEAEKGVKVLIEQTNAHIQLLSEMKEIIRIPRDC